ncbi:hypothetical protein EW145_g6005 [Phellinidium pouzarii]|uniref:Uncharacterized protein n=1 Tax=Phellinidium pouzarii TaxID=167371 RepID=A0A4S4KY27_9AGAM|nr:hypothetical protein EW145_g6005 [Phellinidium pouzarii]
MVNEPTQERYDLRVGHGGSLKLRIRLTLYNNNGLINPCRAAKKQTHPTSIDIIVKIVISLTIATALLLLLVQQLPLVAANTEIRNFAAERERDVPVSLRDLELGRRASKLGLDADVDSGSFLNLNVNASQSQSQDLNWAVGLSPSAGKRERAFTVVPAPLGTPMRDVCARASSSPSSSSSPSLDSSSSSLHHGWCPHELWVRLDLDGDRDWDTSASGGGMASWMHFGMYTLRLSWPAFYPTDFDIELYTPTELASHLQAFEPELESNSRLNAKTKSESASASESEPVTSFRRTKYVRIRLVDTGVRTSTSPSATSAFPSVYAPRESTPPVSMPVPVPFTLILEPLYLDVLPASLMSTFLLLASALALAVLSLPWLNRKLGVVAAQARKELYYPGLHMRDKVE